MPIWKLVVLIFFQNITFYKYKVLFVFLLKLGCSFIPTQ